jgi:hypothetical protein
VDTRRDSPSPADLLAQIRSFLGLATQQLGVDAGSLSLASLQHHTRAQLLACARLLGLTGIHGLRKEALAKRFHQALDALLGVARPGEDEPEEPADLSRKFALGQVPEPTPAPAHIPWSYGYDRVTAMVVDPDRLYVWWEVTDEAIARARAGLGAGGSDAWLNLRVSDVTHRIFDGTNAHTYFDHRIERTDRQWFFEVGRPASTAVVEIGMKSHEGYFVKIARSGRADFPRREPAPAGDVEWLTVRTAAGPLEERVRGSVPLPPLPPPPGVGAGEPVRAWDIRLTLADGDRRWEVREERVGAWEVLGREWSETHRVFEWEGPAVRTAWEAGPFTLPVEPPSHVIERHHGSVRVFSAGGRTHVVYGPWEVIVRGLAGRAERRLLAVWEVHRWWTAGSGLEARIAGWQEAGPAASLPGASERRWIAASELRLGGASERYQLGASELRFLGASETLYAAASELRLGGASEWAALGASETRYPGASERAWPKPPGD